MPKYSTILQNMPDYPFARVGKISRETEQKDGVKVINARIGIPDAEAPKTVKELLGKYVGKEKSTFGYPCDVHPARGIPELIEAIIEDYRQKYGVTLTQDNICVCGWTKEVLHHMVRLFTRGKVLIPDPVYPAYEGAVLLSNNTIARVKTSAASQWLPEFNFSDPETVALYFCDPNNPTGAVADVAYYTSLEKQMKAANVCGIFDKAYKDFVFDKSVKPVSITQVPGLMDSGFEIVSLSKHYNFVGIGLGWIVSSKENIDQWLKFSGHYSQGVEWYKQRAGADALTSPAVKAEMAEYFKALKERRDILFKGLNELGMKAEVPKATPYLWVGAPAGYDDEDFVLNKMIKKAHVAFMPGSYFGNNGKGYFRTTLYLSKEEIETALERIQKMRDW
jgi:LL-diaminopimelate aminotransferase